MKHLLIMALLLLAAACADEGTAGPAGRGTRLCGLDFVDLAEGGSYDANLAIATNLGVDCTTLHIPWTLIETNSGSGTNSGVLTDPYDNALAAYDMLCTATGLKLALTLRPVDLTGKTVPDDLATLRFSDPVLITRFCKMVDFVFARIDWRHLTSLQLGNEIDFYDPGTDTDFWDDYPLFLAAVNAYLTNTRPGLKTGFTITYEGAMGVQGDRWRQWAAVTGRIGVTYYPNQAGFQVKEPSAVAGEISALCTAYPGVDIYLQEAGYQTSAVCGSSPQQQADFISALFAAWDSHAGRIPVLCLTRLYDYSPEHATNIAGGYGIGDFAFIEYLRTLGLAAYDGTAKPGLAVLSNELRTRGW